LSVEVGNEGDKRREGKRRATNSSVVSGNKVAAIISLCPWVSMFHCDSPTRASHPPRSARYPLHLLTCSRVHFTCGITISTRCKVPQYQ
jgi:hypothetical protein